MWPSLWEIAATTAKPEGSARVGGEEACAKTAHKEAALSARAIKMAFCSAGERCSNGVMTPGILSQPRSLRVESCSCLSDAVRKFTDCAQERFGALTCFGPVVMSGVITGERIQRGDSTGARGKGSPAWPQANHPAWESTATNLARSAGGSMNQEARRSPYIRRCNGDDRA